MILTIFHEAARRVFQGERRTDSLSGHMFGSAADYAGLTAVKAQPPIHLLFRLDTNDPSVGVTLSGIRWLPLLCAIRYGACYLGYRVTSETAIKILHQSESKAWDGFSYDGFPEKLPPEPVDIRETLYDPGSPRDGLRYAGVFGYDALSPAQFEELTRFVVREGIYVPEIFDWQSPEEFLREGNCLPFWQGKPEDVCPDPSCKNHNRAGVLRTFAIFREEPERVRWLWGPNCGSLQIIISGLSGVWGDPNDQSMRLRPGSSATENGTPWNRRGETRRIKPRYRE